MKITEKIFNIETGEETFTERDETKEETKARLDAEKARAEAVAAETQRSADRAALLTQLGITEEQAKLLLG